MPEVEFVVLSEWFDWITMNTEIGNVDLIGINIKLSVSFSVLYAAVGYRILIKTE